MRTAAKDTTLSQAQVEELQQARTLIRQNPRAFFVNELGRDLWWRQREVMELLATKDRVAVASANACGKSFVAAGATIWYLMSQPLGYAITTGASWLSLKKTLWPEIHRLISGASNTDLKSMGLLNTLDWSIQPHWGAFAVSPKEPEAFAGYRTPHGVFVVIDEASLLSYEIMEAIEGLCSSTGSKILMIGNPLRPAGPFFDAFNSPAWASMHISALETPNYVTGHNIVPGLASREWVEERRRDWGEGSPSYMARVLGQFPDTAIDVMIPLYLCEQASLNWKQPAWPSNKPVRVGVDVARFGDDDSVIQILIGDVALPPIVLHGQNTMELVGRVVNVIQTYEPVSVNVDVIGLGAGVVDRLHELGYDEIVVGVNVGEAANDSERFANLRCEGYFAVKQWLTDGGTFPTDRAIIGELSTVKYKFTSTGKQILEPKDETKKRLGRSPDKGDALMLAVVRRKPKKTGGVW